jgi:hypothetical protein
VSDEQQHDAAEKLRALLACLESAENLARDLGLEHTERIVLAARIPLYAGPTFGPVIADAFYQALAPVVLRVDEVIGPLMDADAADQQNDKEVITCSHIC